MLKGKKIFYGLTVLCSCGMSVTTIALSVNLVGLFYSPIAEDLGVGIGDVSLFATLTQLVAGICGPLFVKFFTKRKLSLVVGIGFLITMVYYFLMARATAVWQIYLLGALSGIAKTFTGPIIFAIALSNWFNKGLGMATGITYASSGAAAALLSPPIAACIENFGWRNGMLIMGGLAFLFLLPALLFLKRTPYDVHLEPYGEEPVSKDAPKVEADEYVLQRKGAKPALFFACGMCALSSGICAIGAHFSTLAQSVGYTAAAAAVMVSVMMVSNTASKVVIGFICDKWGAKLSCGIMLSLQIIGCAILAFFSRGGIALMYAAGIGVGAIYSIGGVGTTVVVKKIFGRNFGRVFSYVNLFGCIGNAVMLTAVGYSYDLTGSYQLASVSTMLFGMIGIACLFLSFAVAKGKNLDA